MFDQRKNFDYVQLRGNAAGIFKFDFKKHVNHSVVNQTVELATEREFDVFGAGKCGLCEA